MSRIEDDGRSWCAVVVDVPCELEDELVAAASGAIGADYRDGGDGRGRLTIYGATEGVALELADRVSAQLRRRMLDPAACALHVERVRDGRWVERYQAALRPFPVGRRFVVDPTGDAPRTAGREKIVIVPGRAFGTGEHPTTRLCVERLERHLRPATAWVDLGCGSGILSIVARHLGAARVLALDVDGEAVRVARRNVRANGSDDVVVVRRGTIDLAAGVAWDGVVANISAEFVAASARPTAQLLRPGGTLVVSGFLEERRDEVAAALARAGLTAFEERTDEGWTAVCLRATETG